MPFIDLDQIEAKEIVPGYRAEFVHADNMTLAYWTIEGGADLPEHRHVHEQVSNVLEGTFELTIEGVTKRLEPGAVAVIPSNVVHSGTAITDCRILDAFHPVRDDYK
ncbi:MAG TPA: cupin domain-containing protein [Anaerolineales bacterium]|nr:cupin domain-containing protein [Anaerolineales bacterium]HUS85216.1 cupin domain-containing protein [Anaerolineales bacterium]